MMTGIEAAIVVGCILSTTIMYFAKKFQYTTLKEDYDNAQIELARKEELLDIAQEKNALLSKQLHESDRKAKLSGDVLAVLADMKAGGAVLEVTRVDRNDIFFHNGGAYR